MMVMRLWRAFSIEQSIQASSQDGEGDIRAFPRPVRVFFTVIIIAILTDRIDDIPAFKF